MKSTKLGGYIVLLILLNVAFVQAQEPQNSQQNDRVQTLKRIETERADLALRLDKIVWDSYFNYASLTETMIDISRFKQINIKSMCDSVPALKALWQADSVAYKQWQQVLSTDAEYNAIHDEYTSLANTRDQQKNNANLQRYNLLYDRLLRNNPDYKPTTTRKNETRRQRNEGITRYLVNYYHAHGQLMPREELLNYSLMRTLREGYPAIVTMERELSLTDKLLRELQEQLLRERYGMPAAPKSDQQTLIIE
ncbi:MAG: hypothetical protein RR270_03820 [Alistipes sp.]